MNLRRSCVDSHALALACLASSTGRVSGNVETSVIRRSPDQMPQSEEEYWQPARYDSRCRTPKLADPTQSLRLQQPPVAARQGALGRHSRRFRERSPFLSKRRLGRRWAGSSKPCRTLSQKRSKSSRPRTEESMSCRFHPSRPPEHGPGCGLHVGGGLIGDAVLLVVSSRRSKLLVTAADLGWRPLRPVLHPYFHRKASNVGTGGA